MSSETNDDRCQHSVDSKDVNGELVQRPSMESQVTPLLYYLPDGIDEVVSPRTSYLSPDGETPRRIQSYHSLVGEDINTECMESSNTTRKSGIALTSLAEVVMDVELSPFTPTTPVDDDDEDDVVIGDRIKSDGGDDDDDVTTPPAGLQGPVASLSPPLLTTYTPSSTGRSVETGDGSQGRSHPPHPPPSQPYMQQRPRTSYPLPYTMNSSSSVGNMPNTTTANSAIDSSMTQVSIASTGRPPSRPPRAPQASQLVHPPYTRSTEGRQSSSSFSHQHQQQETLPSNPAASLGGPGVGAGHSRTHTDNTNFTFLSALTDATGEFVAPKRRTLSWDNIDDTHQQLTAPNKKDVRNAGTAVSEASMEHNSPGGISVPGSILQPILTDDDRVPVTPPISIWASNLRKATPGTPPHRSAYQRESAGSDSVQITTVDNNDGLNMEPFQPIICEPHDRPDRNLVLNSTNDHDLHTKVVTSPNGADSICNSTLSVHRDEKKESSDIISISVTNTSSFRKDRSEIPASHLAGPSRGPTNNQNRYSLDDFLDATNEDTEEADIIDSIDLSTHVNDAKNVIAQLLPQLRDTMVQDCSDTNTAHMVNGNIVIPFRRQLLDAYMGKVLLLMLLCCVTVLMYFLVIEGPPMVCSSDRSLEATCDGMFNQTCNLSNNATMAVGEDWMDSLAHSPCRHIHEEKSRGILSDSWWLFVFVCCEIMTLFVATISELIIIDFFIYRADMFHKVLGTAPSLTLAQSKGWPYLIIAWGIVDLILLVIQRRFGGRSLFGQSSASTLHERWIYLRLVLGLATTVKRAFMGIFVAKRIVANSRVELYTVKKKLLLLSEVAQLSVRRREDTTCPMNSIHGCDSNIMMDAEPLDKAKENEQESCLVSSNGTNPYGKPRNNFEKSFSSVEQIIADLIKECEKPEVRIEDHLEVNTTDILKFRRALEFVNTEYPFSSSFGRASNRKESVDSSQTVFDRLSEGNGFLSFDVLCRIAKRPDGSVNVAKIRDLIQVFCPPRNGMISKLDFVKSTDSVYKASRLLIANMKNCSQIGQEYEKLVNIAYFSVVSFMVLAVFGVDIIALVVIFTGQVLGAAYMLGSTSAKCVDGILFIMLRKRYGIGDRIYFESPTNPVHDEGPPGGGWIVEKVDLFTTTVRSGPTREHTTFPNGSLAASRIVNLRLSGRANVVLHFKFSIDVTQEQVNVFQRKISEFMEDRRREWVKLISLRCARVDSDLRSIEYTLIVQHREAWQSYSVIQQSRSEIFMFALNLQKALKMTPSAPSPFTNLHRLDPGIVTQSHLHVEG